MWFIGVEVEQETSAPPPKKNPGSAPVPTTLKYVLPTTVCFLLICTGAIIGVEIASAESTRFHGSVRYFKQELSHSQRYILARGPVNLTGSHIEFQEMGDLLVTLLKLS